MNFDLKNIKPLAATVLLMTVFGNFASGYLAIIVYEPVFFKTTDLLRLSVLSISITAPSIIFCSIVSMLLILKTQVNLFDDDKDDSKLISLTFFFGNWLAMIINYCIIFIGYLLKINESYAILILVILFIFSISYAVLKEPRKKG